MTTYTTYDQVGLAEDVSSKISNISPTKTPFQSMIGEEKVAARLFEWQEDSLADPEDNQKVEGADAVDVALTPTVMRSNVTQILEKTIRISGTSDAVKTHGRAKETAYQMAKKGAEIKRDLERAMVGRVQAAVAGDTATARRMASAFSMIDASVTNSNAGTPRAFSEVILLDILQKAYNEGADPSVLMIKPADSLLVAEFAGAAGRNRDFGSAKKVVNAVDIYVSPFGEVRVTLNRFILATEALVLDPEHWKKAVLRAWSRTLLAKTGDSDKHMLLGEFSLKHANFKASGRATDLS